MTNCLEQPPRECPVDHGAPFVCPVHGMKMSVRMAGQCLGNQGYRRAWREGTGPGQMTPDERAAIPRIEAPKPKRKRGCGKAKSQRRKKPTEAKKSSELSQGPGTELKLILARFGFRVEDCPCKARAAEMDQRGVDWCQENIGTITDWLYEEAKKRKIPFTTLSKPAMVVLIHWAIKRAKRKIRLAVKNKGKQDNE